MGGGLPISCPDTLCPPQICTFVNDSSYHNFLPSFHILLPADVWKVELRLRSYTTSLPLIGWLLGDTDIWCCLINLGGQYPTPLSRLANNTAAYLHFLFFCLAVPDYSQTPAGRTPLNDLFSD